MQRLFFVVVVLCLVSSCGNVYYIVRHAEKATPSPGLTMTTPGDPALSREGELRAKALARLLKNKNIGRIFTTNTIRTKATAAPVAAYFNIQPELYSPAEEGFITKLKSIKQHTLIVGHSNTVDDIVNRLTGENLLSDLPDSAYSNIFIVTRKGNRFHFKRSGFEELK